MVFGQRHGSQPLWIVAHGKAGLGHRVFQNLRRLGAGYPFQRVDHRADGGVGGGFQVDLLKRACDDLVLRRASIDYQTLLVFAHA